MIFCLLGCFLFCSAIDGCEKTSKALLSELKKERKKERLDTENKRNKKKSENQEERVTRLTDKTG